MPADRIISGLYQGDCMELRNAKAYDFVVSAALEKFPPKGVQYMHVKLDDEQVAWHDPQLTGWRRAVRYAARKVADSVRRHQKTLVVCAAGLNRSSLITGIALRRLGYSGEAAVQLIRRARGPLALSNSSFEETILEMPTEES